MKLERIVGTWVTVVVVLFSATIGHAQYEWDGSEGDDLWTTTGNWTNNAAPAASYTGEILFRSADIGNNNALAGDRKISGSAGSMSQGLHYNVNAADNSTGHTTDLGGNRLTLDGGTLQIGHDASNSVATIQNGTLALGHVNQVNIIVGQNPNIGASLIDITGATFNVSCAVVVSNLGSIIVGRNSAGNARSAQGVADFSSATFTTEGVANKLKLNSYLWVGNNGGDSAGPGSWGEMTLPSTLTFLEVEDFAVGYDRSEWGKLDFGSGSQLTNLTVRGHFYLTYRTSHGQLLNWPTGVDVKVGSSGTPKNMYISYIWPYSSVSPNPGVFTVTNGSFTGYLSSLYVGHSDGGNGLNSDGLFDVSTSALQIGDTVDMIDLPILEVGARPLDVEGSSAAVGVFRIPASVTNITTDSFALGYGLGGDGTLDIGANSQLKTIRVSDSFLMGGTQTRIGHDPGTGFEEYFPAGIEVLIGAASQPASYMRVSRRWAHSSRTANTYGDLRITNGTLSVYVDELIVGTQREDPSSVRTSIGKLSLTNTTVQAFRVGTAYVGANPGNNVYVATPCVCKDASGYVYLPNADVTITNLWLGDTAATSKGWLELFGTTVNIEDSIVIGPSGVVTTHIGGAACGIDLQSSATADLAVSNGANIHLSFEADPTNGVPNHWGLRMPGDVRTYFQGLTNDQRLTWSTAGLSGPFAAQVDIYFDGVHTYAGIPSSVSPPIIENRGATNVTTTTANLNGYLVSTGSAPVTVSVYWGDSDGGAPTSGLWDATNSWAEGEWLQGSYPTTNVTVPASDTIYYYTYHAENLAGAVWPTSPTNFIAANVWVTAPDNAASEVGPDAGTFTVHRVAGVAGVDITVHFSMAGDAVDNLDYTLSPLGSNVTLLAGQTEATVTLTPAENPAPEPTEKATLVLEPGTYAIGSPASNTIDIADAGLSTTTNTTDVGPWSGLGLDDSWGTAANWTSNEIPSLSFTGKIEFISDDIGNVNRLDNDREIVGTAQALGQGLIYNINAPDASQGHFTDLNGKTLVMEGGTLQIGYIASNSVVTITNGTLVLGNTNAIDLHVGSRPAGDTPGTVTGNTLTVHGTVAASNVVNIYVARAITGNGPGAHGDLDLSGAIIKSGGGSNVLVISGDLGVAESAGDAWTDGTVVMPASLQKLDVGNLTVARHRSSDGSLGFGTSSSLTNLTVRGDFYLASDSGRGSIIGLPNGVDVSVGQVGSPAFMRLGHFQHGAWKTITGHLGITNGTFRGYLDELQVGRQQGGNVGVVDGLLDLSSSDVHLGGQQDTLGAGVLLVGSKVYPAVAQGGAPGKGVLKIPASVTNIAVGHFALGMGNNSLGQLDIGANSQLASLTVTQGLYFGDAAYIGHDDGGGFDEYLPNGIDVQLGSAATPIPVEIGKRAHNQYPSYSEIYALGSGKLVITNGSFTGYMSTLYVGTKEYASKVVTGVLDIAQATVSALEIDNAWIGSETGLVYNSFTVESDNANGKGYVYLPELTVNISEDLYVGDTGVNSLGWLELFGTTVAVGGEVDLNVTGVVTTHVTSVSAGLDIASSNPADFTVAAGGNLHVSFEGGGLGVWGFRMAGDQTTYLDGMHGDGRLTWSVTGPTDAEIHYTGAHTVVRVPPPAGTMILLN